MKITGIRKQTKQSERYSVYIDGKYAFSLSASGLLECGIAVGQVFEKDKLGELNKQAGEDKLYSQSLHYTALRPRSYWEVKTYLTRKHSSPSLAQSILNKLSENNLINDLAFSKAWIENRQAFRPSSRRKLINELRQKHVNDEIIEQAINEAGLSEQDNISSIVEKKRKQAKYQDDLKLMQYLARQGFNYDDIKAAIKK